MQQQLLLWALCVWCMCLLLQIQPSMQQGTTTCTTCFNSGQSCGAGFVKEPGTCKCTACLPSNSMWCDGWGMYLCRPEPGFGWVKYETEYALSAGVYGSVDAPGQSSRAPIVKIPVDWANDFSGVQGYASLHRVQACNQYHDIVLAYCPFCPKGWTEKQSTFGRCYSLRQAFAAEDAVMINSDQYTCATIGTSILSLTSYKPSLSLDTYYVQLTSSQPEPVEYLIWNLWHYITNFLSPVPYTVFCDPNPQGMYASPTIPHLPQTCPIGKYCPDGLEALNCPAFTYQDQTGQAACKKCLPCNPGEYMVTDLASYAIENKLNPSSISNYCGTNIASQRTSSQRICKPCPAGFYCPVFKDMSQATNGVMFPCSTCFEPGKYPDASSASTSCNKNLMNQTRDTVCLDCPVGSICRFVLVLLQCMQANHF